MVAADGPGEYPVVGAARAGAPEPGLAVAPGAVAYITTGAPVPPGADAVVMVEHSAPVEGAGEREGGGPRAVRITEPASAGLDIRAVGSDIAEGEVVLRAGDRLGAAEVGLLATLGVDRVQVHPRPKVAVLSTGDEVVEPWETPGQGQIRDANRPMLMTALEEAGAEVLDLGIAGDSEAALGVALDRALDPSVDVLLTSGGVSMGDRDFVKGVLARHGEVHFGKVLMKPGKPLTFATIPREAADGAGDVPPLLVFGLPGNPVSSIVTFHLIVVPVLRKIGGWAEPHLRRVHATLAMDIKMDPVRPEYHRAVLSWTNMGVKGEVSEPHFRAVSTGGQISSRLLSMRSANALLEIPRSSGVLPAGTRVTALVIGDLGAMGQGPLLM